jgi:hypothetical protein
VTWFGLGRYLTTLNFVEKRFTSVSTFNTLFCVQRFGSYILQQLKKRAMKNRFSLDFYFLEGFSTNVENYSTRNREGKATQATSYAKDFILKM